VEAHDKLAEVGVALRSPYEAIDTSTPHGRFAFQTLASVAELERENIRTRTRDGLHRAFRAGKYMGVVPYSYAANKDARLEIVPEEAEVVREISGRIAEGASLYSVAKDLNERRIPLRAGDTGAASGAGGTGGPPPRFATSSTSAPTPASTK
jgi:DNA invertase Pin-like site-specific DNA recombinase